MPRNVRNFWIEVEIDGQKSKFAGGPQSKDGGFSLTVRQRHEGNIRRSVHIAGWFEDSAEGNKLVLKTTVNPDDKLLRETFVFTKR